MKAPAIFSCLFATAAFILSMLCLFAGSKGFLQKADILTLNVSRIGHGSEFNISSSADGLLSKLGNESEVELEKILNKVADEAAEALNLTDFYSVHVMNHCDGFFEPNSTAVHATKHTTYCSSPKALFDFNATKTISDSLPSNISLSDIEWPGEIDAATNGARMASRAMSILYVIGIGFSGLAALAIGFGVIGCWQLPPMCYFLLGIIAFLALGIASAIATSIMFSGVHAINKYGNDIGISATRGTTFLGLTWAATIAVLVSSFMSCVGFSGSRRAQNRNKSYSSERSSYEQSRPSSHLQQGPMSEMGHQDWSSQYQGYE